MTLECHKSYIIFYIPSISIEIASITINIPSISNQNLVYQLNNIYKSWLSMEVNCQTRSMYVFLVWYSQNIIWYTWYIISNVTFTFWKTWYNNYKFVMPGISHEKLGLNFFFAGLPFSCYITGIPQYSRVTFAQSKVLLFWSCLDFPDLLLTLQISWQRDKW